jgi:hypothetical protein
VATLAPRPPRRAREAPGPDLTPTARVCVDAAGRLPCSCMINVSCLMPAQMEDAYEHFVYKYVSACPTLQSKRAWRRLLPRPTRTRRCARSASLATSVPSSAPGATLASRPSTLART